MKWALPMCTCSSTPTSHSPLDLLGRRCSLGWTDDCYTSACIVAWADSNCDGVLSERELNALDDELDGLSRTVPGFRATDVMACRHALPSHLTTIVVRSLYVTCRLPGLRLD